MEEVEESAKAVTELLEITTVSQDEMGTEIILEPLTSRIDETNNTSLSYDESERMSRNRCTLCSRSYLKPSYLRKHMRKKHPSEYIEPERTIISKTSARCPLCHQNYHRLNYLRKHLTTQHGVKYADVNCNGGIKCGFDPECTVTFNRVAFYRQHLVVVHKVVLEKVTINFKSMDDFLTWKIQEENESQSRFNKFQIISQKNAVEKRTYLCCRSGCSRKGTKKTNSWKIGTYCPAKMTLLCRGGKYVLTYFKTHVGHGGLDEVYALREKQQTNDNLRRQQALYAKRKDLAKVKLVEILDNLNADQYDSKFLEKLLKDFDKVFNPISDYVVCSKDEYNNKGKQIENEGQSSQVFISTDSSYLDLANSTYSPSWEQANHDDEDDVAPVSSMNNSTIETSRSLCEETSTINSNNTSTIQISTTNEVNDNVLILDSESYSSLHSSEQYNCDQNSLENHLQNEQFYVLSGNDLIPITLAESTLSPPKKKKKRKKKCNMYSNKSENEHPCLLTTPLSQVENQLSVSLIEESKVTNNDENQQLHIMSGDIIMPVCDKSPQKLSSASLENTSFSVNDSLAIVHAFEEISNIDQDTLNEAKGTESHSFNATENQKPMFMVFDDSLKTAHSIRKESRSSKVNISQKNNNSPLYIIAKNDSPLVTMLNSRNQSYPSIISNDSDQHLKPPVRMSFDTDKMGISNSFSTSATNVEVFASKQHTDKSHSYALSNQTSDFAKSFADDIRSKNPSTSCSHTVPSSPTALPTKSRLLNPCTSTKSQVQVSNVQKTMNENLVSSTNNSVISIDKDSFSTSAKNISELDSHENIKIVRIPSLQTNSLPTPGLSQSVDAVKIPVITVIPIISTNTSLQDKNVSVPGTGNALSNDTIKAALVNSISKSPISRTVSRPIVVYASKCLEPETSVNVRNNPKITRIKESDLSPIKFVLTKKTAVTTDNSTSSNDRLSNVSQPVKERISVPCIRESATSHLAYEPIKSPRNQPVKRIANYDSVKIKQKKCKIEETSIGKESGDKSNDGNVLKAAKLITLIKDKNMSMEITQSNSPVISVKHCYPGLPNFVASNPRVINIIDNSVDKPLTLKKKIVLDSVWNSFKNS